ncbi:unnamed protein product [Penicillium olsonii]|nr:unnamed protein product [Penicillium olsonii]
MLYKDQSSQKYSVPDSLQVPQETYENEEYFCKFTPRIHRDAYLADSGSWQCQLDLLSSQGAAYTAAVRSRRNKSYAVGCINPTVGNLVALCAVEAIPERLALAAYIIEYGFVHDDLIEYAEANPETELSEANNQLIEGIEGNGSVKLSTRSNVKRQMQAKMATELLSVYHEQGQVILRLWKEMSDVFVDIKDLNFPTLEEYFIFRAVDAGCPWTMALVSLSMDFYRTAEETAQTSSITNAAYEAWVLANDYFSWEKEHNNYESRGSTGHIVSAVFLFMKCYDIDSSAAKRMLRDEIVAREERYCQLKADYLGRGDATKRIMRWLQLLDDVTAGNFAWSMTTARYHEDAEDAYPELCGVHNTDLVSNGDLGKPIVPLPMKSDMITSDFTQKGFSDDRESTYGSPIIEPTCLDSGCKQQTDSSLVSISDFEEISLEPYVYQKSLPSKGVWNAAIDGLDIWYQVPERSVLIIQEIITLLHSSSRMVYDTQNNSPLRGGSPATHMVFGIGQTINSANIVLLKAVQAAMSLSANAATLLTNRLIEGHIGQGVDLHWANQTKIPTEEE